MGTAEFEKFVTKKLIIGISFILRTFFKTNFSFFKN